MNIKRLSMVAVLATLAACGGDSRAITEADANRSNNGVGFGSGHREDTTSVSPTTNNATPESGIDVADSDTIPGENGVGFGSGN